MNTPVTIPLAGNTCDAHKSCFPKPLYYEGHHIVPQGWQQIWRPPGWPSPIVYPFPPDVKLAFPHAGKGTDGRMLWDNRIEIVCRNGHGNTHYWLVLFMKEHQLLKLGDSRTEILLARTSVLRASRQNGIPINGSDVQFATLAMTRWIEAGGSISFLTDRHEYGSMY